MISRRRLTQITNQTVQVIGGRFWAGGSEVGARIMYDETVLQNGAGGQSGAAKVREGRRKGYRRGYRAAARKKPTAHRVSQAPQRSCNSSSGVVGIAAACLARRCDFCRVAGRSGWAAAGGVDGARARVCTSVQMLLPMLQQLSLLHADRRSAGRSRLAARRDRGCRGVGGEVAVLAGDGQSGAAPAARTG